MNHPLHNANIDLNSSLPMYCLSLVSQNQKGKSEPTNHPEVTARCLGVVEMSFHCSKLNIFQTQMLKQIQDLIVKALESRKFTLN